MSTTTDRLARLGEVMRDVQSDCEQDATKLDSTFFTPLGVGEAMGSHLAMTAATARVVEVLVEEIASLQRTLNSRTEHLA